MTDTMPDGAFLTVDRGPWMQTVSGGRFHPLNPAPSDVNVGDIAHSLALLCRFNGQSDRFYSVAEHSVLISRQFTDQTTALWGLLHDGTEAYVGDMITPLKKIFPEFKTVENKVKDAIIARFGLVITSDIEKQVKAADTRILLTERDALMSNTREPWEMDGVIEPLEATIAGWTPEEAKTQFLRRFAELVGLRHNHLTRDIKQDGSCAACDRYLNAGTRELAIADWMEDQGYDPIGASDMIGDAITFGRHHPWIPAEQVRDVWWAAVGEATYYPKKAS